MLVFGDVKKWKQRNFVSQGGGELRRGPWDYDAPLDLKRTVFDPTVRLRM